MHSIIDSAVISIGVANSEILRCCAVFTSGIEPSHRRLFAIFGV